MVAINRRVVHSLAASCAAMAILACSAAAQDDSDVDLALVLAVDASSGMSASEAELQREGIAEAITDPQVFAAIKGGKHGRIAVTLVEWGSPGAPQQVVRWHVVGDTERAADFAYDVRRQYRPELSGNAIGDGVALGAVLIANCPCSSARRVIDVSGDAPDGGGQVPIAAARGYALKAGIIINALAILNDDRKGPDGRPWLVDTYEQQVIGGAGAFVMAAETRADFAKALKQKLIQEIASR
jgi:hypothetical protein